MIARDTLQAVSRQTQRSFVGTFVSNHQAWPAAAIDATYCRADWIRRRKPPVFIAAEFKVAAKEPYNPEREVRLACRDSFRQAKILKRIIPLIEEVLAAGGLDTPGRPKESVAPAIPNKEQVGDAGHRG